MRKLPLMALVFAAMAISSTGFAASFTTYGKIETLNAKANTVRLVNGDSYKLPADIDLSSFNIRQSVKVTWDTQNPNSIDIGGDNFIFELKAKAISAVD